MEQAKLKLTTHEIVGNHILMSCSFYCSCHFFRLMQLCIFGLIEIVRSSDHFHWIILGFIMHDVTRGEKFTLFKNVGFKGTIR